MKALRSGAIVWHDGSYWAALDLAATRHQGYAGPSLVQRQGFNEILYAEVHDNGTDVLLRHVVKLDDPEHPAYWAGPGERAGFTTVVPEMVYESEKGSDPYARTY